MPGNDWADGFLTRHREKLSLRLCQNIKRARAGVSRETLNTYFDNLTVSLENIPPSHIVNLLMTSALGEIPFITEVIALQDDLINVLRRSGMELKKWASNISEILDRVPVADRACELLSFDESASIETKVLGLQWSPREDSFMYTFRTTQIVNTKRGMLSLIARMFDPLGLLSPVIFLAKQLLQRVWQAGVSWDEPLPPEIADSWKIFVSDLPTLQQVIIPRYIGTQRGMQVALCGFFDASTAGYAAVVYIRILDSSGNPSIHCWVQKQKRPL